MKTKIFSKLVYLAFALPLGGVGGGLLTSCADDFLDQENTTSLNQDTFFDSEEACQAATAPLYNYVWNDFNGKAYYGMGDGRANNITAQYSDYIYPYTNFTDNSLSQGLADAWNSLYSVVAQSNNAINNMEKSQLDSTVWRPYAAEARFMRGLAFWYIGQLWGGGIIYTNTSSLVNNYASAVPAPREDLIEFAIRDMEYAACYLPDKQSTAGRVNKWSAYGMLSRFYLTMAGLIKEKSYEPSSYDGNGNVKDGNFDNVVTNFNRGTRDAYYLDLAQQAASQCIANSDYDLVDSYGDLFTNDLSKCNNNCESLFQLQWNTGSTDAIGWGCNQAIEAFFGWSTMVSDATNWGGATYCSWDLWKEFNQDDDGATESVRRHWSVASTNEEYPELGYDSNNKPYTYGVTETPGNQGANIRKYVVGVNKVNGFSYKQSGGNNTYMMRLAEVYLNYCEATLSNDDAQSTDDYTALYFFDRIRMRANMPLKDIITYEDIRHERRVEFAFEGLYWYDLLNRSYYRQNDVVQYLNNQYRNASYGASSSTYDGEKCGIYYLNGDYDVGNPPSVATATERSLVLQVPDADQGKCPALKPDSSTGLLKTTHYVFSARDYNRSQMYIDF